MSLRMEPDGTGWNQMEPDGKLSPKTKVEKAEMMKISYASAVGRLMYAMVCTRPDIGYAIGVVRSGEPVHE